MRPSRAHAACEHDLLGVRREPLAELLAQLARQVEDALHVRLGRPRAHDPAARAAAEQQVERVREHRLARAGLAGEHVQTRARGAARPARSAAGSPRAALAASRRCTSGRRRIAEPASVARAPRCARATDARAQRRARAHFAGARAGRTLWARYTDDGDTAAYTRPPTAWLPANQIRAQSRPAREGSEPLSRSTRSRDRLRRGDRPRRTPRHALSCLLMVIENLEEIAREHGSELPEQTLAYFASTLRGELRRFDRVGTRAQRSSRSCCPARTARAARSSRGACSRGCSAIKVETRGRAPAAAALGRARAWRREMSAEDLLARARAAARAGRTESDATRRRAAGAGASGPVREPGGPAARRPVRRRASRPRRAASVGRLAYS